MLLCNHVNSKNECIIISRRTWVVAGSLERTQQDDGRADPPGDKKDLCHGSEGCVWGVAGEDPSNDEWGEGEKGRVPELGGRGKEV